MTTAEAIAALLEGHTVRVHIGTGEDDPVLDLYLGEEGSTAEGMIISWAVGGWSMGCVEPVCSKSSAYLVEMLDRKTKREKIPNEQRGEFV